MRIHAPVTMTTSRALFVLACFALGCFSGCSIHRPYLSGEVSSRIKNDTLIIKYDIHIKNPAIDSVAFQLLPPDEPAGRARDNIYYASEERVKDSVYRSLGDSLACCLDPPDGFVAFGGTQIERYRLEGLDSASLCWWRHLPRVNVKDPYLWNVVSRQIIDSIIATGSLDSLRKISVPCGWGGRPSRGIKSSIDTTLQADSVIFGHDPDVAGHYPARGQKSNGSAIAMRGQLRYPINGYREPARYALKFYSESDPGDADRVIPLLVPKECAREKVWRGIIPPRPKTRIYRSAEPGNMLGMSGGIGGAKNDIFSLSSRPAIIDPNYGFSLAWGVMYYTPHLIHSLDFDLLNSSSSGDSGVANDLGSVLLSTRYHPRRAISRGQFFTTGFGYSNLNTHRDKKDLAGEDAFDIRLGAGYETSFDRIEYAYHTAHGGYHRFDLLVGIAAVTQGKAGLRFSLLTGDRIRTAALELYMENRIDPTTLKPYNPRPLIVQAALYAGMIAGWAMLFE